MGKKDSHQLFKSGYNENGIIHLDDEQLLALKRELLKMLIDFKEFAEKNGISYTLSGGSVIGAVRHQGFIPWDDDIDINIPRKDYNILIKTFEENMGNKYVLCSPEKTCNHGMLCAQIKKKDTIYRSFNELSKPVDDCGIYIDVFVIENTFDNIFLRKMHGYLALAFGYLTTCRKTYNDLPYLEKYLKRGSESEKAFIKKAKVGMLFRWLSLDTATRWGSKIYSLCKNDTSKYVTIPSGRGHYFKEIQLRSDLCGTVDAEFETITIKIPKGYDAYLTKLYGSDYMQLPPIEKRESHPLMEVKFGDYHE